MKNSQKLTLYSVAVIILLIITVISYITLALPNVGEPESIKVELTPTRITRGEYLVDHVALCVDCHSTRDWSKFAAPMKDGYPGGGGQVFNSKVGFPGEVHVPNITPYNLKNWTDGELFRAITTGERKDGSAIFPLMPWPYYAKMSREDVYAIIAYIRTLKPVAATYPPSNLNFPLNILVHTMPQKAPLGTLPPLTDSVKYGEYVCTMAGCVECHSKSSNGKITPGTEFAGGHEYLINGIVLHSANITPDKATGIGNMKEADFVEMFKSFKDPSKADSIKAGGFQTIMPWYDYAGMSELDLKAIYKYLRTVKPVKNKVVTFFQYNKD
jgi:mono/diheme cytochrome c family protein